MKTWNTIINYSRILSEIGKTLQGKTHFSLKAFLAKQVFQQYQSWDWRVLLLSLRNTACDAKLQKL